MKTLSRIAIILFLQILVLVAACAQLDQFKAGPVFSEFGKIAEIETDMPIGENDEFKVVFDVAKEATPESLNRSFDSVARFINMHVDAGVPLDNINVAVVVHGKASFDLTQQKYYEKKYPGKQNGNIQPLALLGKANVDFYLCGQSAAYHGVKNDQLLPGVKMALSAMTAHALLQQQGYTLNPF